VITTVYDVPDACSPSSSYRPAVHSMYFDARDLNTVDLVADAFKEDTEVVGGVLADECAALYVGPDELVPL
jgi:tRNA(adenine34) deaminase